MSEENTVAEGSAEEAAEQSRPVGRGFSGWSFVILDAESGTIAGQGRIIGMIGATHHVAQFFGLPVGYTKVVAPEDLTQFTLFPNEAELGAFIRAITPPANDEGPTAGSGEETDPSEKEAATEGC